MNQNQQELLVDFIMSLDGYGSTEGWPGWWGLQGPEYLAWLDQQPKDTYTLLMGANTYRQFAEFAVAAAGPGDDAAEAVAHKRPPWTTTVNRGAEHARTATD